MDVNQLKETIGRRLKRARKECDLTQDEVAEKLGLTSVGYGSFERGANLIALNYLIEVSRIFNKPLTYFLPTPYVTPEEINDLSHDPNFQRLVECYRIANADARRTVVDVFERMVGLPPTRPVYARSPDEYELPPGHEEPDDE